MLATAGRRGCYAGPLPTPVTHKADFTPGPSEACPNPDRLPPDNVNRAPNRRRPLSAWSTIAWAWRDCLDPDSHNGFDLFPPGGGSRATGGFHHRLNPDALLQSRVEWTPALNALYKCPQGCDVEAHHTQWNIPARQRRPRIALESGDLLPGHFRTRGTRLRPVQMVCIQQAPSK